PGTQSWGRRRYRKSEGNGARRPGQRILAQRNAPGIPGAFGIALGGALAASVEAGERCDGVVPAEAERVADRELRPVTELLRLGGRLDRDLGVLVDEVDRRGSEA